MSELDEANRRLRAHYRHPERATLTVAQLAHVLGVGRSKIYDMIHTNELPVAPIRFGTRIVFSRAKVEEFLGRDPDLSGGPLREAQQEAEHYRETLEQVIDLCRRVLNAPQNRGRAKALY
jgi:excisionase family DNA binding protein